MDLFRRKHPPRQPPVHQPAHLPARRRNYPVPYRQLTLMDLPRDLNGLNADPEPPDLDFAGLLDLAAHEHARAHGWSKTRLNAARQGLQILARLQDTPGAAFTASEAAVLAPAGFNLRPILEVLDSAGLLQDDRQPAVLAWFGRQIHGLPQPMADELQLWFETLLYGRTAPPRSRPRAEGTVRLRLSYALPAVKTWAGEGRLSLREITRGDITRALPDQGSDRAMVGQALRSLFRTLKAHKAVFSNPTTRISTGRPETRTPLPLSEPPLRAALQSENPARSVLAALTVYHALRSGELRALLLTDVRDGRLHLEGRTILLAPDVRRSLAAWLDHRTAHWPNTANPHLLINTQTAVRTTRVSHVWVNSTLGISAQAVREDRILDEALTTKDVRRLCDLFGLGVDGAGRYLSPLDHPSLYGTPDAGSQTQGSGTLFKGLEKGAPGTYACKGPRDEL